MPGKRKFDVLAFLPGTPGEIAAKAGCTECTVRLWLRRALEGGLVHIGSWKRTQGCPLPSYLAGSGLDAKRPTARGNAAYLRKSKRRASRERAKLAIKRKAELQRIVIPTTKQSIFAALGL